MQLARLSSIAAALSLVASTAAAPVAGCWYVDDGFIARPCGIQPLAVSEDCIERLTHAGRAGANVDSSDRDRHGRGQPAIVFSHLSIVFTSSERDDNLIDRSTRSRSLYDLTTSPTNEHSPSSCLSCTMCTGSLDLYSFVVFLQLDCAFFRLARSVLRA